MLKKVRFADFREIFIIPNNEYLKANYLTGQIWWTDNETQIIRAVAYREFNNYMVFTETTNPRNLFKNLWYDVNFDEVYKIILEHKMYLKKLS